MKNFASTLLLFFLAFQALFAQGEQEKQEESINIIAEPPPMNDPTQADVLPEFDGGIGALSSFLMKNIRYPQDCMQAGIQGKVYVVFLVEKDGSISNAKIQRSVHPSMDQEVLRIMSIMPKWKPGLNYLNEPVKAYFVLPVKFELEAGD